MFVSLLTYSRLQTGDDSLYQAHREYVQARTAEGSMLCAGPRLDAHGGGVIIAYGDDEAATRALIERDPYVSSGFATYELVAFKVGLADPKSSLMPA